MNLKNIEILNIVLLLIAGILSILAPFELFLFVYAFLGPLHYVTEINWLQDRHFYQHSKKEIVWLVLPIIGIGLATYTHYFNVLKLWIPFLIYTAFLSAIYGTNKNQSKKVRFIFILLLLIGFSLNFIFENKFKLIFSLFLPTLIHVFIFTGLFLLSGFLKSKSKWSFSTLIVFMIMSLIVSTTHFNTSLLFDEIKPIYHSFEKLNIALFSICNNEIIDSQDIYFSDLGRRIMQFIAFTYTYHYFNWFSKTSVIQWHKTSKIRSIALIVIWITSIFLYLLNYQLGLYWLYLLSLTHVILEFPLNIITLKNIFKI